MGVNLFRYVPKNGLGWIQDCNDYRRQLYSNLYLRIDKYIDGDLPKYWDIFELSYVHKDIKTVIIKIMEICLHYAHWNQYYYDNMSNDELYGLIDKGIKSYLIFKKKIALELDFQV
jgi:hypothetical protein